MTKSRCELTYIIVGWAVVLFCFAGAGLAAPEVQQILTLQPGWNAVFLEVEPENNDTESVFQGLPIESVWTWNPKRSAVQFIQDPDESQLQATGWLGYFPFPRPEAFLTNLFRVRANQPYLIKLGGTSPVDLAFVGRPQVPRPRWIPNAYNLVGMALDPARPPTFEQFFAASPAHAGQPIWRLTAGQWQMVSAPASTLMQSGEAFWIFTQGASDYTGPLAVDVRVGDGLDFGATVDRLRLTLSNRSRSEPIGSVTLRLLPNGAGEIAYLETDTTENEVNWIDLTDPVEFPLDSALEAGQSVDVVLGAQRANMSSVYEALLEVTDGAGTRVRVPVEATTDGGGESLIGGGTAGLWVGNALIDAVAEVESGNPALLTPADSVFALRLLIHVDGKTGTPRLLKEAIQMWEDGDPQGRMVLVSDHGLLSSYEGSILRDGVQVGVRVSTAGFDFVGDQLDMTGSFGAVGTSLTATIDLPWNHPTNPFYHRYHPEHDGECACDEIFPPGDELDDCQANCATRERYGIRRTVTLSFEDCPDDPGATCNGTYAERFEGFEGGGLHSEALAVSGTFSLSRVSTIDALNPAPGGGGS